MWFALNSVELKLFSSRVAAICDEMGQVLRRTAFSPNIKDRLDFSCAIFGAQGELYAQAAHIPVHLGSMAFAMGGIIGNRPWQAGDVLMVNDPFLGGTHLPDVTVISPVFLSNSESLLGFVANRAHHANIGCDTPGSMPVSTCLEEEGLIISPTFLFKKGKLQQNSIALPGLKNGVLIGDFAAQVGANQVGVRRLQNLIEQTGSSAYLIGMQELNDYADRLTANLITSIEPGEFGFKDMLDDDGCGNKEIGLAVSMRITPACIELDFSKSADQVEGNLNCPEPVVAAAAYFCFRCLMPAEAPSCEGLFRRIKIITRVGSLINARRPAAVAAGNVETSTRLVDVVFGALAQAMPEKIAAASQGTMNNVAMGAIDESSGIRWDYYETLAGGMGGGPNFSGLDAVHTHMTNTLNTPIESLEMHYPLRVHQYRIRPNSGGGGAQKGGNGIVREYEFLETTQLSLLSERRLNKPWGLRGGSAGACGNNLLNDKLLPSKCNLHVVAGDRLIIETPGGGGWGAAGPET